ncbi:MAG: GMC family oxidoreductase [Cyclobacteriaceae bacterium]|nr:GMC family oxidoreductase [Cyclobacteriaceae bacterium]MDH4296188.1 GMC family oxidoreductase [Cyclobacteriaceae bacterium]MDH5250989.1 GMC family oxidoreductase [Cyclobacteriaceae bacterium]
MAISSNTYDAIVIGSGISGGWAAKELCDKGLKTLVLERGRNIEHLQDYPSATKHPWEFPHRGKLPSDVLAENPVVGRCYAFEESTEHFFVKDHEHPYVQEKPFDWIRGYQVGGKSLMWARETQRWSNFEFTAPARYGYGIDWPIRYKDIAPWYSHVELFAGICGNRDGLEAMPDGEFLPPFEMNCVEKELKEKMGKKYKDRFMVHGRGAHLTQPTALHLKQGRGICQARDLCARGCPYGGYFSSVSATLPWAQKTGNLTIRPHAVVHSIIYDEHKGKASGVRIVDALTKETHEFSARIIFVNAACLNSNLILLNSTSSRFPNGLGNNNGLLGKHIIFHNYRGSLSASYDGFDDQYYFGRSPSKPIMANYRNLHKQDTDYLGGFLTFVGAYRSRGNTQNEIGAELKKSIAVPGDWKVYMSMQGETLPKETNHVRLSTDQKDQWGIPLLVTSVDYDDNDEKMVKDFLTQSTEMLAAAGCTNIEQHDSMQAPGLDIHEMGGVRMGNDPETSMLNKWNQLHHCKNVFVTDGACMASTGTQNPSLFYMAITARAVDYAAEELKKLNL